MGPKRGDSRSGRTAISSESYSNPPPLGSLAPTVSEDTALAASTYRGSFDYNLPTPTGGVSMMLDYHHRYGGQGMERRDTWNGNSMRQLSGALYTNQVIPSSPPFFSSSSVPTDDMLYSQTPLGDGQTEFSPADALAHTLPLEVQNTSVQRRADKKCTWPGCGKVFQTATRLERHEKSHSAPDLQECEFCGRLVTGDDGLERHTRRHFDQAKMYPRLDYFEGARHEYDNMTQRKAK
jgi:hypothetical protein